MENAEEILQCLDEFSKLRPKEIPPELEYYLSFVARTGDPVYQWPLIKCLFREKLINVITEFYEACPTVEIPPCPNVEIFNYEAMKGFILEKLDTFAAAPFTVQRICELLTSPRKEYNRIDKYMRALEKNILVVSTREPGNRKSTENGESVVNGLESEHGSQEMVNSLNSDINVEVDMDEKTVWHKSYAVNESSIILESHTAESVQIQESYVSDSKPCSTPPSPSTTVAESVITTRQINYIGYTNEMLVEPSTTISNNEDVATTPQLPDNSDVPTVFSLTRSTDKEDEQIYVTEDSAFIKADCSEMDTNQIISETETEPITPPEPEETQHLEKTEQPESSVVEAVVESSSQTTTVVATTEAATTSLSTSSSSSSSSSSETTTTTTTTVEAELELETEKEVESSSNETTITSSDEMAQSSTEPENNSEVTASDHQEVTESNIVIGPEDMQVEDISPEPETEAEAEAEVEAEIEADPEQLTICEEEAPAHPKTPEIVETEEKESEEISAENSSEKEESPREEVAPSQKEEEEAADVAKVTESN